MSAKKRSSKDARLDSSCPCGSNKSYAACCELLHNGAPAPSAESLMRSRYCAFVLDLPEYLQRSWHHSTRAAEALESAEVDKLANMRWLRLQIKRHEPIDEYRAVVEFIAHYKVGGRAFALHETSRFVREGGHWFYIDGQIAE